MKRLLNAMVIGTGALAFSTSAVANDSIRIAHVTGFSGPLAAYAEQLHVGMQMGFEYATAGTMQLDGRPIALLRKDDQTDPARARALAEEAYAEDDAHIVVGSVASGVALAMLPIAEEYERIMMPEGVADAITGSEWNRYIVRVGRNSTQDAISNAVAVSKPGVCIATIAQDYAFGRDGVAAYKTAVNSTGGRVVHEEYLPTDATDFTAASQRLFNALRDRTDCPEGKYIFSIWAGAANPLARIQDLQPERFGIQLTTGGNILPALVSYADFPGMQGATYYYYELPQNEINDWFVAQHFERHNAAPDFFTAQGFAQAMAIVSAVRRAGGSTDTEDLIAAFRGLEFDSPKGRIHIRAEDHQALQAMYHFTTVPQERSDWFNNRTVTAGVPELVRVVELEEMTIPVMNR